MVIFFLRYVDIGKKLSICKPMTIMIDHGI